MGRLDKKSICWLAIFNPNLILALLFTFAFSILGHLLFALGALRLLHIHLISLEFMIWGTAILVMTQLTRGLMDHRRGMNLLYGLTHAPANVLVLLLLMNSARRSLEWDGDMEGQSVQAYGNCRFVYTNHANLYVSIRLCKVHRKEPPAPTMIVVAILNLTGFSRRRFDIDISAVDRSPKNPNRVSLISYPTCESNFCL